MRGEFTFIDAETGGESSLSIDRRNLRRYRELLAGFRKEWVEFSRQSGVALLEVSSAQPIDAGLFKALADGGLIG